MQDRRLNDVTPEEWDAAFDELYNQIESKKEKSDGSTANYYKLPPDAKELQDLIIYKNMNAQIAQIFGECFRYGEASHCDELRGINKILFYANSEKTRLEKYSKK